MSPEQYEAADDLDHRSDLYSLGRLLYEGLSGNPSFQADTAAELQSLHLHATPEPLDVPELPTDAADLVISGCSPRTLPTGRRKRRTSSARSTERRTPSAHPRG
ncbi:hypothetical protein [Streptomyces sp. NPDC004435]|uniref:hypothetical protein n=1 Tax=Streptomyces sp. NPDC004435 TaxID=3364701 RepID=UPI0036C7D484